MSSPASVLVVTPTLGCSPWLARTVASVRLTLGDRAAHVLVAPTGEAERLRRLYPQCSVINDTGGRGVYHAINLGLSAAPSADWQWFTWINDDDELLPGFSVHAERALAFDGRRTDSPWFYGRVRLENAIGGSLGQLAVARQPADIVALAQAGINPLNQQGLLAPRGGIELQGGIREDLRICADVDFWLRAAVKGATFVYTAAEVALFRLHQGQVSGDEALHRQEFAAVVEHWAPTPSAWRCRLARWRFRLGNFGVYLERIRRCGWKGGFDLLAQPEQGGT